MTNYIHAEDQKWISIQDFPMPHDSICLLVAKSENMDGTHNYIEILNTGTDKQTTLNFLDEMGIEPLYWMRVPEPPTMIEEHGLMN